VVAVPPADKVITANKTCGECTLCCKVMAIEQLAKPVGTW
jgi:Zn-dependent alcohol dehydrogenase